MCLSKNRLSMGIPKSHGLFEFSIFFHLKIAILRVHPIFRSQMARWWAQGQTKSTLPWTWTWEVPGHGKGPRLKWSVTKKIPWIWKKYGKYQDIPYLPCSSHVFPKTFHRRNQDNSRQVYPQNLWNTTFGGDEDPQIREFHGWPFAIASFWPLPGRRDGVATDPCCSSDVFFSRLLIWTISFWHSTHIYSHVTM